MTFPEFLGWQRYKAYERIEREKPAPLPELGPGNPAAVAAMMRGR